MGAPQSVARAVADETGASVVELQVAQVPAGGTYQHLLRELAAQVAGALSAGEVIRLMAIERWDERYAVREYLWDIGPNQFVEQHLAGLRPGSAIDLAAGEGRNAVWLARRGKGAGGRLLRGGPGQAHRLAVDHDVADRVEIVNHDVLTYVPPEPVDLVVIAYLQLPADQRRTALAHAASWLRPGGTLFIVAHDRTNVAQGHGGPSDADHCYDLGATVAMLSGLKVAVAEVAAAGRSTRTKVHGRHSIRW